MANNNSKGVIITDFGGYDKGQYVFARPDGKIVVMGVMSNNNTDNFAIANYNNDGRLNLNFSDDGKLTTKIELAAIYNAYLLHNGKFLIVGESDGNFAVARYNIDGSLDTSFDKDGKLSTDIYGYSGDKGDHGDKALVVIEQSDGKLVVAGQQEHRVYEGTTYNTSLFGGGGSYSESYNDINGFGIARYNTDGSLDTSFSDNGMAYADFSGLNFATAIAIQPDGKIVTAGKSNNDFVLARFTSDGRLDGTFSGDGKVATTVGGAVQVYVVNVLDDGKILAVGVSDHNLALVRYNSDGNLDTSFGGDGVITSNLTGIKTLHNIAMQADGKFLATGTTNYNIVLVRYNADGSLDSGFSKDGIVITDVGTWEEGNNIAVQKDGKILVTGISDTNMALVRYNNDGSLDTSFNGITTTDTGKNIYGDVDNFKNDVLIGTRGDDKIYGLHMKDDLSGGAGNDELYGGYNNDLLFGESGDDKLYGELGNDYMDGGKGNDKLIGSAGFDTLTGGEGKDSFYLLDTSKDTLRDFSPKYDTVYLENKVFDRLTKNGVLDTGSFKFGRATDANDYVLYDSSTGAVSYDADGSGSSVAVQVAVIGANLTLTAADFVVM